MPGDVIGPRGNMLCLCVAHILQKRQGVKCIVCYIVIIAKEKNKVENGYMIPITLSKFLKGKPDD